MAVVVLDMVVLEPKTMLAEKHQGIVPYSEMALQELILDSQLSFGLLGLYSQRTFDNLGLYLTQTWRMGTVDLDLNYGGVDLAAVAFDRASQAQSHLQAYTAVLLVASVVVDQMAFDKTDDQPLDSGSLNFARAFDMTDLYLMLKESDTVDQDLPTAPGTIVLVFDWLAGNQVPARKILFVQKVLQLNCKTQLMERDALNQQHVMQCYAIALIKSRRSLLVVGKSTGW